ncbi:putative 3,4-dihydroxy-2-butanone kinase [Hibiscus syriacus]|uniref:3,4-dihydroxy-2-butanone kinase n=1 Tax=Hibiscus syriacus TaxID=106335 RepID=A0A6A2XRJ8_HIBSY|nr:putative 3,4-dihydroxy-2-butanone kinase [Hibiscus syriacus]
MMVADVVTEFVEGLVETYPGLQYLDGFPEVKVVIRADASGTTYDKVAVISGSDPANLLTLDICLRVLKLEIEILYIVILTLALATTISRKLLKLQSPFGFCSLSRPLQLSEHGRILETAIEAAVNAVIDTRDSLNDWDGKVGDGDCGSTMYRGAEALEAAIAAVSKYGGTRAGYRTLLDALIPASAVLKERLSAGDDSSTAFVLSSEAALAGAESTKDMQAQAGRSSYVSAAILATVPDPGAMAAAALAVKAKYEAS